MKVTYNGEIMTIYAETQEDAWTLGLLNDAECQTSVKKNAVALQIVPQELLDCYKD